MPQLTIVKSEPLTVAATDYGTRADGTPKGDGFLGPQRRADGGVSSEITVGVNIGGKDIDVPTMVPTLTPQERNWLLTNDVSDPSKLPPSIVQKASDHARSRILAGKSVFADPSDTQRGATTPPARLTIGADPDPNTAGTFARHVKDQLVGLVTAARHPIDATMGAVDAHVNEAMKAADAYRNGDYQQAAIRAMAALVPVIGPGIANAAEELTGGKTAAALGDAVGMGLSMKAASKAPALARAVVKDLPKTTIGTALTTAAEGLRHPVRTGVSLVLDALGEELKKRGQPKPEPPAPPATSPTPAARQAAQTAAKPSKTSTTPNAKTAAVIRSVDDLTDAEQAHAAELDARGMSPEKILQALQASRDFTAAKGTATPEEAAAKQAHAKRTGKF